MTGPNRWRRRFDTSQWSGVAMMSTVGITLVLCSAIGLGIGLWVDRRWHTAPYGAAIGFLIGTAAGFLEMFRTVTKASDDD